MSAVSGSRLRVLALHSFRTNAKIFEAQMQMTQQIHALRDLADFEYLDGPHVCTADEEARVDPMLRDFFPSDHYGPYREWWNAREDPDTGELVYARFDEVVALVSERLASAKPPFDGLVGFSQGAGVALAVGALQMRGELPSEVPALRFMWIQSGALPRHVGIKDYFGTTDGSSGTALTEGPLPPYDLPVLVTASAGDRVVPAVASKRVTAAFSGSTYIEAAGNSHAPVRLKAGDEVTTRVLSFFVDQATLKLKQASAADVADE